MCGGQLGVKPI